MTRRRDQLAGLAFAGFGGYLTYKAESVFCWLMVGLGIAMVIVGMCFVNVYGVEPPPTLAPWRRVAQECLDSVLWVGAPSARCRAMACC